MLGKEERYGPDGAASMDDRDPSPRPPPLRIFSVRRTAPGRTRGRSGPSTGHLTP